MCMCHNTWDDVVAVGLTVPEIQIHKHTTVYTKRAHGNDGVDDNNHDTYTNG